MCDLFNSPANVYLIKYKNIDSSVHIKNIVARNEKEALEIFNMYIDNVELINIELKI